MSMTNNRIEELRGSMLTVLPPNFVSLCTSSRYGGKLEVHENNRTEFTSTEDKIIEVINNGIGQVLETCWKDLTPITITVSQQRTKPSVCCFCRIIRFSYCLLVCNAITKNRFIII